LLAKKLTLKEKSKLTSMLALVGSRLDKNIDFETIWETAKKANSNTKAYSEVQNMRIDRGMMQAHRSVWTSHNAGQWV
jgi:hypothetical protein